MDLTIYLILGANEIPDYWTSEDERDELKDFQNQGGVNMQMQQEATQPPPLMIPGYAKGGEVQPINPLTQPNAVATHWPEQDILINATRGRISQYLDSMKPSQGNQLIIRFKSARPAKGKNL